MEQVRKANRQEPIGSGVKSCLLAAQAEKTQVQEIGNDLKS